MGARLDIQARPLTAQAFAPFGHVIDTAGLAPRIINRGTSERFHDLAPIDVFDAGGKPIISIFRGQPFVFPVRLSVMERHPLGSQAFIPLQPRRFLIVVAPAGPPPQREALRAFISSGSQGVSYARGVWHHPLLALDEVSDFAVIDRAGAGENLDETELAGDIRVVV